MRSSHLAIPQPDAQDAAFITGAITSCMLALELSDLAVEHGLQDPLRAFSDRLSEEHTRIADDLRVLGRKKGVEIPVALSVVHQNRITRLTDATGRDFAEQYLQMQTDCHQEMVEAFEAAEANTRDEDVRALAARHLPRLRACLTKATSLEDNL